MAGAHPTVLNGSAAPAASTPVKAGVETLDFGTAAVEGKVVVKFNKLIQWFDMEPSLAIALAESLITKATEAQRQKHAAKIIVPDPSALIKVRK